MEIAKDKILKETDSNVYNDLTTKQPIFCHDRPIIDIKFHPDGDVFFAASKDSTASVSNLCGVVLGTFEKHDGAITAIAPFKNNLLTAGADLFLVRWDVITGKYDWNINSESVVRGIDFDQQIYFCTDDSMNKEAFVGMIDPRDANLNKLYTLADPGSKIFKTDNNIIISTTNGKVCKFDIRNNKIVQEAKFHNSKITDMKPSACRSFFATSSSDSSSKIIDTETFAVKKRFDTEEPINSVAIFNTNDIVVCVGGINARDVTVTQGKGSFDTNFFDIVTQQKIGYYSIHFGTINAVDVHPQSTHIVSGGEDGAICLVKLGDDFRNAPFTKFD